MKYSNVLNVRLIHLCSFISTFMQNNQGNTYKAHRDNFEIAKISLISFTGIRLSVKEFVIFDKNFVSSCA